MKKADTKFGIFKLVLTLVLSVILLFTIVACNDVDNDGTPPTSTPTPSPTPSTPGTGNGGGTNNNGGNTGNTGGNTGGGNTEPQIDLDFSYATTDFSEFTINIPDNAAYLGITTVGGGSEASSAAASSENPDIQNYLTAFDEYMNVIDGKGGTITFSQVKYTMLKHKMRTVYEEVEVEVLVTDEETGEQRTEITTELVAVGEEEVTVDVAILSDGTVVYLIIEENGTMYLATEDGEYDYDENGDAVRFNFDENTMVLDYRYVYEKDETGAYITLTDEDGNVIYADENVDPRERTIEVIIEKEQADFALDVLKLKVVGDYAFVTFSLPLPDYCYNGGTWRIKLPDGSVKVITSGDLPKRYEDCTEAEKAVYNTTDFVTDLFVQSYAINTVTKKIYSLAGLDIAEINDDGFFRLKGDPKADWYSIVVDNDVFLFQAVKVTDLFNDKDINYVKKDNNGIIYVEDSSYKSTYVTYNQYNTNKPGELANAYVVYFPSSIRKGGVRDYEVVPEFVFDTAGNAYSFVDGMLKKVIGGITNEESGISELIYSNEDYSQCSDRLQLQLDGRDAWTVDSFVLNGNFYNVNGRTAILNGPSTLHTCIRVISTIDPGEKISGFDRADEKDEEEFGYYVIAYNPRNDWSVETFMYGDGLLVVDQGCEDGVRVLQTVYQDAINDDNDDLFNNYNQEMSIYYDDPYFTQYFSRSYYKIIEFSYNGSIVPQSDILNVSVTSDTEIDVVYFEIKLLHDGSKKKTVYCSIDTSKPVSNIVCYDNKADSIIKQESNGNDNLIVIAPIN